MKRFNNYMLTTLNYIKFVPAPRSQTRILRCELEKTCTNSVVGIKKKQHEQCKKTIYVKIKENFRANSLRNKPVFVRAGNIS